MTWLKAKISDILMLFTAGTLFSWGIICAILDVMKIPFSPLDILLLTVIFLFSFRIILANKYTMIIAAALICVSALIIFFDVKTNTRSFETVAQIIAFLRKAVLYISGYEPYIPEYDIVFRYFLCGVISMFSVIFVSLFFNFLVLSVFGAAMFGIILSSGNFNFSISFTICISAVFMFLIRYLYNKRTQTYTVRTNLTAILLVFICFCIAWMIPAVKENSLSRSVENIVYPPLKSANKFIYSFFSPKYFYLSSTGYLGRDSRLGGDALLNDETVMEVTSKESLYLAGAYKDKYTGYSWENTTTEKELLVFNETTPTIEFSELLFSNFMMSLDNGEFDFFGALMENPSLIQNSMYASRCNYIENGTITLQMQQSLFKHKKILINIKDSKTFSVFSLISRTKIAPQSDSEFLFLADAQNNITVKDLMRKNTLYEIHYREEPESIGYWNSIKLNSRRGILKEIQTKLKELHEKNNFDKNQISICLDEKLDDAKFYLHMIKMYPENTDYYNPSLMMNYEDFLNGTLIPRADEIYERYTALPQNFPKRIFTLTENMIKNADTDYAKAKSIESFLRKFPYTLTPGNTPEDRDFVDYFLFDLQKGYCTYFASAFVTMCRAAGLPARYVEGYITPPEKNAEGIYVITNRQGHAWGEVYFEGYGWVKFEPTPPASSQGRPVYLPKAEEYPPESKEKAADIKIAAAITSSEIYKHTNGAEYSTSESSYIQNESMQSDEQIEDTANITTKIKHNSINIITLSIFAALSVIAALLSLYILINLLLNIKKEKNIDQKSEREAVISYFYLLIEYFKFWNCEKKNSETIFDYSKRINGSVKFKEENIEILYAAELFSKAYYSNLPIETQDKIAMKNIFKETDQLLLNKLGKLKYIYYLYFLSATKYQYKKSS